MDCCCLGFIVVLLCYIPPTSASIGDKSWDFRDCLRDCEESCHAEGYPKDLPWYLTVFFWNCQNECKYNCMHKVTAEDVIHNRKIRQFYGKWPFIRFLGIQEPASTLFSLLNGLGHIVGWQQYVAHVPQDYKMYDMWKAYMLVNVNAWTWSTVFHTRDLNWTEKMDYFSATSLVLFSIFSFFVRVVGPEKKWKCGIFGVITLSLYCSHVFYLGFVKFDYGYNIKVNVTIGIINLFGWLIWCIKNYHKQHYVWKCAAITTTVFFLVGLEVFDFPPIWWSFDAHALWHLGTIPLCYFWYSFLIDDSKYHIQEEMKGKRE